VTNSQKTIGVGGSSAEEQLAKLSDMTGGTSPIGLEEYKSRLEKAQSLMAEQGLAAIYLDAGANLRYFTGMQWKNSERMVGAFLFQSGEPQFIAPVFEIGTLEQFMEIKGPVHGWEEHECPYKLSAKILTEHGFKAGAKIGIDESTPFFISNGLALDCPALSFVSATPVTRTCRQQKSAHELALMTRAKEMTLAVHKAAAAILREGITAAEVGEFLDAAHRKVGAPKGSYFIEADGFGPGYKTPGLPHRTGHGIGLDIHEWPYLNWGDDTPLAKGMCFSSEPMICKYGEFGVRLEDHFYMTEDGPKWFTQPSYSIDEPFKGV